MRRFRQIVHSLYIYFICDQIHLFFKIKITLTEQWSKVCPINKLEIPANFVLSPFWNSKSAIYNLLDCYHWNEGETIISSSNVAGDAGPRFLLIKYVVIEARLLFSQLYMLFWAFSKLSSGIRRVSSKKKKEKNKSKLIKAIWIKKKIKKQKNLYPLFVCQPEWSTLCLHELL